MSAVFSLVTFINVCGDYHPTINFTLLRRIYSTRKFALLITFPHFTISVQIRR